MSLNKPIYKLRDWIDPEKLDNDLLNSNLNAIDYLKENPNIIHWPYLSSNPKCN